MLFCRFAHNGIFCTPPSGITKKPAWCFVIWTLLRMEAPATTELPVLDQGHPHHWPKERERLPEHQHERHNRSMFKAVPGVIGLLNPWMKMNQPCNYCTITTNSSGLLLVMWRPSLEAAGQPKPSPVRPSSMKPLQGFLGPTAQASHFWSPKLWPEPQLGWLNIFEWNNCDVPKMNLNIFVRINSHHR